jgi:DNA-binding transcriptional MerR regulator
MNKIQNDLPELIDIKTASKLLSISPWTLRSWDKRGILVPIRIGSRKDRRYKKEDIIKILNEGTK